MDRELFKELKVVCRKLMRGKPSQHNDLIWALLKMYETGWLKAKALYKEEK